MKALLLNDGGYVGLENVNFPVVVDAILGSGGKALVFVPSSELVRVGASYDDFSGRYTNPFNLGTEAKIIE